MGFPVLIIVYYDKILDTGCSLIEELIKQLWSLVLTKDWNEAACYLVIASSTATVYFHLGYHQWRWLVAQLKGKPSDSAYAQTRFFRILQVHALDGQQGLPTCKWQNSWSYNQASIFDYNIAG
jgi:hypothetical protein